MTVILPGGLGQVFASAAGSAFDPANKTTLGTLSNNNKTFTYAGAPSSAPGAAVRGIKSYSSGKHYFELAVSGVASSNSSSAGVCNAAYGITSAWYLGDDLTGNSAGMSPDVAGVSWDLIWQQGLVSIALGGAPANGQVIGVHVDATQRFCWFRVNNTNYGFTPGSATSDITLPTGTIYPACSAGSGVTWTLNTGGPFTYAPVAGFTAWG